MSPPQSYTHRLRSNAMGTPNQPSRSPEEKLERHGGGQAGYEWSQCHNCTHRHEGSPTCDAFGDRHIPMSILKNDFDHRENHPDDNGLTWEPEDEDAVHPFEEWSGAHGGT